MPALFCQPLSSEMPAVRLEVRAAADGTADAAMVRLQQENVQLRTTAERTAAELRQLRDSRRAEPDSAHCAVTCPCCPRLFGRAIRCVRSVVASTLLICKRAEDGLLV